jgi:hypothetical protein
MPDQTPTPANFAHDPTWRVFRIMAEFIEGFTMLGSLPKSVTVFGSARIAEDNEYYVAARELGQQMAKLKIGVVTGGGPGVMEAANRGAFEAGGASIGLNIRLPHEQSTNPWVTQTETFNYFYTRKVMLSFAAEAYIYFPGGFGTLDEFFEIANLMATGKIERHIPIILYGSEYWQPLLGWMKRSLADRFEVISADEIKFFTLVDSIQDIIEIVRETKPRQIQPFEIEH